MSFATLGAAIILGEMKSFNEMSATGTRRLLALAVVGLLLGPAPWAAQEPPPPSGGTFRVDVNVVNVYCTVKDGKGRLIADLEREDFDIKEDGTAQELKYFVRETDRPLTLVLAVDTSGSQRQVLAVEKTVGAQFLEQVLRPSDLAALVTFDVNVDLLQDFTQEAERLDRALQRARINAPVLLGPLPRNPPGTRLYDAVYLASKEKLGREVGRKAIILVSDGVDMGSHYKKEEALEAAQRADVMVYSIGISDPGVYGRPTGGRGTLKKLSEETGGAAELRSQYTLGYTPTNRARDGKFRKVRVKVKRKGLKVQARRGYYAPRS
jgi:VWFA-related protein